MIGLARTLTQPNCSYATWFYDTVFGVFRQLSLLGEKFRLSRPKLTFHSDLRRRAALRRALPRTSIYYLLHYTYGSISMKSTKLTQYPDIPES